MVREVVSATDVCLCCLCKRHAFRVKKFNFLSTGQIVSECSNFARCSIDYYCSTSQFHILPVFRLELSVHWIISERILLQNSTSLRKECGSLTSTALSFSNNMFVLPYPHHKHTNLTTNCYVTQYNSHQQLWATDQIAIGKCKYCGTFWVWHVNINRTTSSHSELRLNRWMTKQDNLHCEWKLSATMCTLQTNSCHFFHKDLKCV